MLEKRSVSLTIAVVSNLVLIAGILVFGWSPTTIIALFLFDAAFGIGRILFERLSAFRPRGDATPADTPHNMFEDLYGPLLDKRGGIDVASWLPTLYPRNLPFVIAQWISVVSGGVLLTVTWFAAGPPAGSLEASLVVVLPLFATKHVSIVTVWSKNGVYERASPTTVRPREILYTVLVAWFAVLFLAAQSGPVSQIVAATIFPLVPKVLLDVREVGIGSSLLGFDPSSETTYQPLFTPSDEPQDVFQTDRATVVRQVVSDGFFYALFPGLLVVGAFSLLAGLFLELRWTTLEATTVIVAGVTLVSSLSIVYLVNWLGQMNVEYRVYDDTLVAYDRYLEEPQWVVLADDIRSISTVDGGFMSRMRSGSIASVVIERSTDDDIRLTELEQPAEFVDVVRLAIRRSVPTN